MVFFGDDFDQTEPKSPFRTMQTKGVKLSVLLERYLRPSVPTPRPAPQVGGAFLLIMI